MRDCLRLFASSESEPTFLPVVITASELVTMVPRFRTALADQLSALGLGSAAIAQEVDDAGLVAIGKTASRQILGVMTDLAFQAKWELAEGPPEALLQLSLRLSETPFSPLRYVRPAEAARKLLDPSGHRPD